jgi:hypothetical protein
MTSVQDLLKASVITIPWPTAIDGDAIRSIQTENEICSSRCVTRPCLTSPATVLGVRCNMGLTVYGTNVAGIPIRVYGVTSPQFKEQLPNNSIYKAACKGRRVTAVEFAEWNTSVQKFAEVISKIESETLSHAYEPLHDSIKLARDISQLAERLIDEKSGPTSQERFLNSTPTEKALYKSSELLVDTFDSLVLYLNPAAASFGNRSSIEVYKLVDKLVRIANLSRKGESRRASVVLQGNTRKSFLVFSTFKLLPLVLIDNGQKYSRPDGTVTVKFEEQGHRLTLSVQSQGPQIYDDEKDKVFRKGIRGRNAPRLYPDGMGQGLFIAKLVASAHSTDVRLTSTPLGYKVDGVDQATNVFAFQL